MGQTTVGRKIQRFTIFTATLFCVGVANAEPLGTIDIQRLPSIYEQAVPYPQTANYQAGAPERSSEFTLPRTDSLHVFTRRSAEAGSFFELPEFVIRGQDSNETFEASLVDFSDFNALNEFSELNESKGSNSLSAHLGLNFLELKVPENLDASG